jgi:large subunit ribosomal protein L23
MAKFILVRPIITEKANAAMEKLQQYTFQVDKGANKIEIKNAVEKMYNVTVTSVNTLILPAKTKNRNSRNAVIRGRKASYKKAIVRLSAGETIDIFGSNNEEA